ncbi:MAG TPA: UvrB/UvrC motif-containing protein [Longimicrobiaceae bacterium]|nr:UvrB/UvrC motif-containing protein [Longimicrobiaceae bacterium]
MAPAAVETRLQELRATVRAGALNRPGIYRMLGSAGVVLYVGKSKRVRTRLMGYFRARSQEKAWRIVRDAVSIDWEYVPSEFASLLRELELIKMYRPPYNVRQKRDGLHCFLRLSGGGAPKLHVVRRVGEDSGRYFGPFLGGQRIVEAVKELNDALMLRDCRAGMPVHFADQEDLFGVEASPLCPRYELRLCCGPCAARCTASEYVRRVEQARAFLDGGSDGPIATLEARMGEAAATLQFEHAASLRDRIGKLEMLRSEFIRQREASEGLSFLYAVAGFAGDHRVYAIRSGSVRAVYRAPRTARERRTLLGSAEEHFERPESRAEVTTPKRVEELFLIGHWFRTKPNELDRTFTAERWSNFPLAKALDRLVA